VKFSSSATATKYSSWRVSMHPMIARLDCYYQEYALDTIAEPVEHRL
jgi:hypothetical protein